ncbi:hypothetical protein LTR86_006295 [Recurvomyces mirabilis]|nr:hypothetical protein LTR86_006295 [Recurvomyces mirabilis]
MSPPTSIRPSSLACGECRKRHLKCDAVLPICTRCATTGLKCIWTPSRRGGICRAKRRSTDEHTTDRSGFSPDSNSQDETALDQVTLYESGTQFATGTSIHQADSTAGREMTSRYIDDIMPTLNLSDCEEEHLTNLFYSNFHPAHPILVPRSFYRKEAIPRYLRLVICFVGSHYATSRHSRESLAPVVAQAMTSTIDSTAPRVQALVLYTIVLHASHQAREASACIAEAAKLAIDIGLNRPSFATNVALHDPRQQESLRRTWFELYIVDGYMAALSRHTSFGSNSVGTHPYLPCEDSLYGRGVCDFHPRSLAQFDDRVFATAPCTFSSYCYRIDAIRIIARVLAVAGANDACPDEVQAVDNAIASWKYHLPSNKADVIDQYGNVDHLLFQANVFIQWATILLHFSRSDLPMTVPTDENLACAKDLPRISATSAQHTVKAVAASKELSNLAALPWCSENAWQDMGGSEERSAAFDESGT